MLLEKDRYGSGTARFWYPITSWRKTESSSLRELPTPLTLSIWLNAKMVEGFKSSQKLENWTKKYNQTNNCKGNSMFSSGRWYTLKRRKSQSIIKGDRNLKGAYNSYSAWAYFLIKNRKPVKTVCLLVSFFPYECFFLCLSSTIFIWRNFIEIYGALH